MKQKRSTMFRFMYHQNKMRVYLLMAILMLGVMIYTPASIEAQDTSCTPRTDWHGQYVVQRGDNLYRIAQNHNVDLTQLATANCIANIQVIHAGLVLRVPVAIGMPIDSVPLTLIAPGDNGRNGVLLGCDDSAVQVKTTYPFTNNVALDLRVTLETMFGNRAFSMPSNLINAWGDTHIQVNDISINNGRAVISLSGNFRLVGTCGDARFQEQLRHNIFMYPQIESAYVTVNGQNLLTMFDQSGLISRDASFTRLTTPERCPIPIGWHKYQIQPKTNLFRIATQANSHYSILQDRNCIADASRIIAWTTIYTPQPVVDETQAEG